MTKIGILPLAAVLLAGCAGAPACRDGIDAAEAAADERQPPGAWIGGVDAACRTQAIAAWSETLAPACAPVYGFHAARNDRPRPTGCAGVSFAEAWNLGEMLSDMAREHAAIVDRLENEDLDPSERARLRQQRNAIERDRPQLEAIARMEGWLPPAEVPGSGPR
jgi:hypothetical protein